MQRAGVVTRPAPRAPTGWPGAAALRHGIVACGGEQWGAHKKSLACSCVAFEVRGRVPHKYVLPDTDESTRTGLPLEAALSVSRHLRPRGGRCQGPAPCIVRYGHFPYKAK